MRRKSNYCKVSSKSENYYVKDIKNTWYPGRFKPDENDLKDAKTQLYGDETEQLEKFIRAMPLEIENYIYSFYNDQETFFLRETHTVQEQTQYIQSILKNYQQSWKKNRFFDNLTLTYISSIEDIKKISDPLYELMELARTLLEYSIFSKHFIHSTIIRKLKYDDKYRIEIMLLRSGYTTMSTLFVNKYFA